VAQQLDVETSIEDLISLRGKVAVVTGAARGIGHAIARRLAEAGAALVIGDRDVTLLTESVPTFGADASVEVVELDASDPDSQHQLAAEAARMTGRLDIWVNDAGIFPFLALADMTPADWRRVIDIDLSGYFYGAQAAAATMKGEGVIINVSSIAGLRPDGPNLAHYTAAKAGVIGLTKALAVELGPRGIRALAIAPGFVTTEGIAAASDQMRAYIGGEPAEKMAARSPLGRVVAPDDVARVVLFAASNLAHAMTGSTLIVDAGVVASG
jgi:NAD(P)-dependent dehydrogenase (short-subunit alcohol dehydrogenase family)